MPNPSLRDKRARLAGGGWEIKAQIGAGAGTVSDITITGIAIGDSIVAAFDLQPPTAASGNAIATNLIDEIDVTAADTVQCSTTDTSGNQVLVFWVVA